MKQAAPAPRVRRKTTCGKCQMTYCVACKQVWHEGDCQIVNDDVIKEEQVGVVMEQFNWIPVGLVWLFGGVVQRGVSHSGYMADLQDTFQCCSTSTERTTSLQETKWLVLMCPLFRGFVWIFSE